MGRPLGSKNKNSILSENGIKRLRTKVAPTKLEYYLQGKYWHENMSVSEIGKELGISGSSVTRLIKQLGVEIRTKEEQLKKLARLNKGRKHSEQSKVNMSIGVYNSYTTELRKRRTKDNKATWAKMSSDEITARTKPGLKAMHAIKWGDKK